MFDPEQSQLPRTATLLAKALDILEERLFALPVQMITKDPMTVDVSLLDHLAWEHSVDVWDLDWPEDVKRRVIAVSSEVHRFKGTPFAVRTALAAFDVDTDMLEWWQPDGVSSGMEPGSFRVTAYAGRSLYGDTENAIDNRMVYAMNAVIQRVAPVSRRLIFRLGERFFTDGFLRTGIRQTCVSHSKHDPQPRPATAEGAVSVRTGQRSLCTFSYDHQPASRPCEIMAFALVRLAVRARTVSSEIHDVQRRAVT